MREKKRCRWLALLLAVVMLLSVLPTAVFAARDTSNDEFYKIVHLDCGRKYFSPENIKKIIDNAAAAGFNQVELYLSDNQGFRFALDDMNVTTSTGNTYDLTPALGDGYSDGSKYPDGSGKYLTQSEMTDIISYAAGKGIDIVPCINVPGHMGAILEEFSQFKYSGSNSSIDLENAEAVAFALAITEKYATYFAGQGVKFYNLGADEYANDLSTMGFQGLYTSGKYQKFVDFLNSAAQIVIGHNMTPRAFNDGIYYNENNTYSINPAIQVCYWSCGWNNGYYLASAQYLVNQGLDVINTHGDYYWVLGNTSWQCSANKASQFDYTSFQYRTGTTGNGTISDPAGAMFCIWCDVGNANGTDGGTAVVSATADVIAAFGAALPASEPGGSEGGETEPTEPSDPVEVTKNETITVTVDQTAMATISGYNFAGTYTTEDPSIATVEVTGVDGTEATTTYTQASVSCNTLISSDSGSWTAASGYYYKADDGNYYPVYAKRSSKGFLFWWEYTYTWGYSTTDLAESVTEIGTQKTDSTSTSTNISVYRKTDTEGTPASTTVTFTGVAVGTTYVTVGNTRYTINVVAEDLSKVTPLTVEFWITNQHVTANGNTSMEITADTDGVYSENGILISNQIPAEGTQGSNTMVFWKCTRLASDNKQTTGGGVDKTKSGNDFTYVRYWDGSWAYSADGENWTNVASGDQIVAYYLQKTQVTEEITTLVSDYGNVPGYGSSLSPFVMVDYAVKYESGELTPSSFPTAKTIAFHCNYNSSADLGNTVIQDGSTYYRKLGYIKAVETADYEVYMITLTPTSDTKTKTVAGNATGANSYTYGGTEKVIWVDDEANLGDFADESLHYTSPSGNITYTVGGEPNLSGLEIYKNQCMLVTYYVRAKVTEDSLSVHYIDQTVNHEFYSYNIAVANGTLFNENIGLANPWKGALAHGSVVNSLGKTQTVSADLSTMPAIGAQYRFSEYTCEKVERSEDGKEVYLYYTFNNTHKFVIDFGLPLKITTTELGITGNWTSATVAGATYGTATATIGDGITYTPTKVLTGVETLQLTLTDSTGSVTHQIYIYPASNVLYEDDFLTVDTVKSGTDKWVKTDATVSRQQSANQSTLYGYDDAYKTSTGNSMGSAWTITDLTSGNGSKYLTTTFTGNGFDLIGTCGPDTGYVYLLLQGAENKLVVIDTSYVGGGTLYQVPLAHEMLTNGTYTAYIRAAYRKGTTTAGSGDAGTQMSRAAAFSMSAAPTALDSVYDMVDELFADGFEIDDVEYVYFDDTSALAELENSSRATYAMSYALNSASAAATEEAEVNTTEPLKEGTTVTIDGFRVYRESSTVYLPSEQSASYVNVLDAVANGGKGVYVTSYTENGTEQYQISEYEGLGGPENELYLPKGASVTFNVEDAEYIQASLRAVAGATSWNNTSISSNTEMYYSLTAQEQGKYVIVNTGDNLLAIGNLKTDGTVTIVSEELKSMALSFTRMMMAAASEPDPEQPGTEEPAPTPVFTPETFKTRVNSIRTRSKKIVTLTITASTDVDHVVVNGKTYYPMNKLLVKWGLSKTYVFTIMDTAGASETRSFEIVAYNADGLASSTYTDAG